ncbi:nb-arc domain containing protein [Colletotrichum scovillei]|nr:nb-arc domain containing protein [Colletotrichum scovillei]
MMYPRFSSTVYATIRSGKGRKSTSGEKALIAAKFEECRETLQSVCTICENLKSNNPEIELDIADQVLTSFKTWGNDIGASSYNLDRSLRLNQRLRDQVVALLNVFQDELKQDIEALQYGAYQLNNTNLADPSFDDELDLASPLQQTEGTRIAAEVQEVFLCAEESLDQLKSLNPALREAYPEDLNGGSGSSNASSDQLENPLSDHVELTRSMFPGASKVLIERLGRANWRRQQSLRVVRERRAISMSTKAKISKLGPRQGPRRDVAVDAFNFQQPALKGGSDYTKPSVPRIEETSERPPKQDSVSVSDYSSSSHAEISVAPSLFSRPHFSRAASFTSYAQSTTQKPDPPPFIQGPEHREVPLPPRSLDGQPFTYPAQMKEHIAEHLEQLALTAVCGEESTEEDDSDDIMSQSASDTMSERGTKLRMLQAFAEEQGAQFGQRPKPAENIDENDINDVSDEDEPLSDYSRATGDRLPGSSGAWRVQELMNDGTLPSRHVEQSSGRIPHRSRSDTDSSQRFPLVETRTFPKDESFKGREKELANLYKILSEPGRVYVLSAEGGMGKTTLAAEFTYRYEQSFEYIFWVQAETQVGASETFNQIALVLDLAAPGTDQEELTKIGREFLESTKKRWLMVLDNVEKWDNIDGFTPMKTSATTGSILITTRYQELTAPSRPINYYRKTLEELPTEEGRELLLHGLPLDLRPSSHSLRDPEYKAAGDLATLVGLPLVIVLITGYMKAMNCKPSEFATYWDSWWMDNNPGSGPEDQKSTKGKLDTIMKISTEDLSSDANKVLRILSFLDSDGVPKDLLVVEKGQSGPPYLQAFRIEKILNQLISKHFISEKTQDNKKMYIVHRSVQIRISRELHKKTRQAEELFKLTVELVRRRLPRPSLDFPDQQKWSHFKEYLPHVATLQKIYSDQGTVIALTPFIELAELFKDGGVFLWQRFLRNDAMRLLLAAERILDQLETNHDELRAEIHVTMNLLLQYLGISRRKEISERAKKILDFNQNRARQLEASGKLSDVDRIRVINAFADYANSLLQGNDFKAAEAIYKGCHERLLTITSEESDPFAFAKLAHHMAYCSMYRHDFAEAILLAERAIRLMQVFGDKLLVLRFQFDLACIVLQSGDLQGSLDQHEIILAERMRLQGKDSYFTLQSQYAVGALYSYLARWDDAEWQVNNALQKAEGKPGKSVWSDAATARAKFHLSQILKARNGGKMSKDAEKLAQEGKDVLSKLLVYDDISGVEEDDTLALFDHLQPVFGGRWTGMSLLKYVS